MATAHHVVHNVSGLASFVAANRGSIRVIHPDEKGAEWKIVMHSEGDLQRSAWISHRDETGIPVGADAAWSMAVPFPAVADWQDGSAFQSILVFTHLQGGAAPTVDLEVGLYDPHATLPEYFIISTQAAQVHRDFFTVDTYGMDFFIRIAAVANNPTDVRIRVAGNTPSPREL